VLDDISHPALSKQVKVPEERSAPIFGIVRLLKEPISII
jgi:hypothetical protein